MNTGISTQNLEGGFEAAFNSNAETYYFAPGRINLIGEHTDYNGGRVFPCAISLGTYAAVSSRSDNAFHLYSANFADQGMQVLTLGTDEIQEKVGNVWTNYPKGMLRYLIEAGNQITHGLNVYIEGNLPDGAGLSSSASLEMLFGKILQTEFDLQVAPIDMVKFGVKVENEFIGLNSGIMDQFAVEMGKKDNAVLLDTNTLEYEHVPLKLGEYVIIIMNTNKRRELADSKYNEHRRECDEALAQLQTGIDIPTLGALDKETFDEYSYLIQSEPLLKRARHAVFENQRVGEAVTALQTKDLAKFGRLVNASHVSLQYDFEVTGKELDTLVHTAWEQDGVLGARMIGGGYGGCAIALVQKSAVKTFEERVGRNYQAVIGYAPDFYVAEIADGPQQLQKE
ncbi:galactokinase [Pediococcus inopinatus]|uniref:Galactokinase n=1 Tax=Pediococcus inopinatus TaxID=114090 RepID=A0ABZ0Q5K4_9LACO|nr:galactokinase [Pediococcus inopinatus]WPC20269.1 galactokinase [Pediococcus inopinatus]WPC21974.1 galactokinase [Pediococcus inopinatus]WPP09096.1 galactokinase [Pediococcus inopinatus]